MSIVAMTWVFQHSEATLGQRLVLLSLAEFAHDDGTQAFPSVETLKERTRLSERAVQYALRALQASGAIEHTGKTKRGTNCYSILMTRGVDIAPPRETGGVQPTAPPGVQPTAPDPLVEPLEEHPPVVPPLRSREVVIRRRVIMVDRKQATEEEITTAAVVLGFWNRTFGQKLSSEEWLAKIIMRLREHPEYGADEHVAIVQAAQADPWWKGPASPSVVYGNGAQFERSVEAARQRATGSATPQRPERYGRGLSTRQMLEMTEGKR